MRDSLNADLAAWADVEVGRQPANNIYYVHVSGTGEYSLTPAFAEKIVEVIADKLFKWNINFGKFKPDLEEYLDWLLYIRVQTVTREGTKFIDCRSNEIVVPDFYSTVLERIGIAYSETSSVTLKPRIDEKDYFDKYGKTPEQARSFVLSFAHKLSSMFQEAGLPFTTSISKVEAGDFETMALNVVKARLEVDSDQGYRLAKEGVRATSADGREHPIHGIFASMLGLRQLELTFKPQVYYDTFEDMKDQLLKVVTHARSKPRTVSGGTTVGDMQPTRTSRASHRARKD